jgi:hypothetical protein
MWSIKSYIFLFCLLILCYGCGPKKSFIKTGDEISLITDRAWKEKVIIEDIKFNRKTGEIRYSLPEAAIVRLRIGIKDGGPLLRNLVDWEPREEGENREVWDGWDESHVTMLLGEPEVTASIEAIPFPENTMADRENPGPRNQPELRVEFTDNIPVTPQGIPILRGIVPVNVLLDDSEPMDSSLELYFFVDGIFMREEPQVSFPFTYRWNTKGIIKGEHTLNINLATKIESADENFIAIKNVKVLIEREK